MARVHDLLAKIADAGLRDALLAEVRKLENGKKFGLVYEEHLPEAAPMPGIPIRVGMTVATRSQDGGALYRVRAVAEQTAKCRDESTGLDVEMPLDDLVAVTKFGEPIFPYLEKMDEIEHGGGDLWHTLIQADNYHALQLLEYLYAGKVDCIYIDPPYNTGAKDWKYNNDYVDGNDAWRHSKWLSMMEKRLAIAKRLLNPADSVMIVTIDEKEYLHLGMLLEQMFPEARIQMVTSVINPKGNRRDDQFSRCEEYLYFVYIGSASIVSCGRDMLRGDECSGDNNGDMSVRYRALLRQASNHGRRVDRPNLFYPLLFEASCGRFLGAGKPIPVTTDRDSVSCPAGVVLMWPIASNGVELTWNLSRETLLDKHSKHFVRFGKWNGRQRVGYYLSEGMEENFRKGMYRVKRMDEDGAYVIEYKGVGLKDVRPLTIWNQKSHSASEMGTSYLNLIIGSSKFTFPKSLYAVHDAIRFFVANKPNALILDFFAGSGTTLHAVNLLNAEDGGRRQCILVTNNEVSNDEAVAFRKAGLKPGDAAWEAKGIAQYVTWPRTTCSIRGVNVKGEPLKGEYLTTGGGRSAADGGKPSRPMADGFRANAAFFRLGFLEPTSVSLGRRFKQLLPVLWMKAGAVGRCPEISGRVGATPYCVWPQNRMAVLFDESAFAPFKKAVRAAKTIDTVYVVTDFDPSYRAMARAFPRKTVVALNRDYLDSFRINTSRN